MTLDKAHGNQGMHDQILALKWIQSEIKCFGGNPKNVTIMGESAGAMSCLLHLVSPLSRGLFHKIIASSGSPSTPFLHLGDNYVPQWWVEFDDELSWLFTNRFSATRYMKVKRMGITEILRRIWLFSANKIKSSESFSKQPTQLIIAADNWLKTISSQTRTQLIKVTNNYCSKL